MGKAKGSKGSKEEEKSEPKKATHTVTALRKHDIKFMRQVTCALASMMTGTGKTSGGFWEVVVYHMKLQGWRSPLKRHITARLLLLMAT